MTSSTITSRARNGGSDHRAVARARAIVVASLPICLMGFADGRAEGVLDGRQDWTASNEIGCRRHVRSHLAGTAFAAGAGGPHSVAGEGEIAATMPIWRTITLGTQDSARVLRGALATAGCGIGRLASEGLADPKFTVSTSRTEVDLVVLSVRELGFGVEGTSLETVYARAAQLGLTLCPAEVAPQLRLQYRDQPLGEFLRIAMEPIDTEHGHVVGLSVVNGGAGLALLGAEARPDLAVPATVRFVFVRPR